MAVGGGAGGVTRGPRVGHAAITEVITGGGDGAPRTQVYLDL